MTNKDWKIGTYTYKKHECHINWHYEKNNGYVTIWSHAHGSLLRFKPVGELKIIVYPLCKKDMTLDSIAMKVIDDGKKHLVDYLKWVIEGGNGTITDLKTITFKELKDLVLANSI